MLNINTQSYWNKVYGNEVGKFEWRHYTVGFNKIRTYLGLHANAGDTVLDVGCGYGMLADILKPLNLIYCGWDFSEVAIARLTQKGYRGRCIDFTRYHVSPADRVDHVVSTEFLEHMDNPMRELSKLGELARKSIIITVPNNESPDERSADHVHSFDCRTLQRLCSQLPQKKSYLEPYQEEFIHCDPKGQFKVVRSPQMLAIVEKPQDMASIRPESVRRADFHQRPPDICVSAYSSDHTPQNDHFDIIYRCLMSIVKNTPPEQYRLRIGCNNLSPRALAFVNWLVERYGAVRYIGESQEDPSGKTIYPKYPLMRKIYEATDADWVIWFDDDCYVCTTDWLDKLQRKINGTPEADQFGDLATIVLSPSFKSGWIEPAEWYNPQKIFMRDFPEGKRIVSPFIRGGFYAISRTAIDACDIPDRRLVHNDGDWTTGMALAHQGYGLAHYLDGVIIGDEPRRGIHENMQCRNGVANQKKWSAPENLPTGPGAGKRCSLVP